MSIPGELERARRLALVADEAAAKELLLSLMPEIEHEDRDDLGLEVFAQLGEVYLARARRMSFAFLCAIAPAFNFSVNLLTVSASASKAR